jgi:hypothetical protein
MLKIITDSKAKNIIFTAAVVLVCLIGIMSVIHSLNAEDANAASTTGTTASASASTSAASAKASALVKTAESQLGNVGGKKYWSWYGYSYHVAWCACFVSWCADQNGLLSTGTIPKFSYVPDAVNWFRNKGQWKSGSYTPQPGDIIFFDIDDTGAARNSGNGSHVGIVIACRDGYVYTVEGNRKNVCVEKKYKLGSDKILGYGIPEY